MEPTKWKRERQRQTVRLSRPTTYSPGHHESEAKIGNSCSCHRGRERQTARHSAQPGTRPRVGRATWDQCCLWDRMAQHAGLWTLQPIGIISIPNKASGAADIERGMSTDEVLASFSLLVPFCSVRRSGVTFLLRSDELQSEWAQVLRSQSNLTSNRWSSVTMFVLWLCLPVVSMKHLF